MTATFLDTNVLVSAFDTRDPVKQSRAIEIIERSTTPLVVSAQVLGEFYVTVTRKLPTPLPHATAAAAIDSLSRGVVIEADAGLVRAAVETSARSQLSYGDALILEAAARADCDRVLTEDLADGRRSAAFASRTFLPAG
ncbi:PIN domain-containing protein [Microbacterium sp.]|uniref:PIN domain-containing protein n=1 Tax=Microbacterium sp. TaxID=51671 RepID=UPI0039E27D48